MTAFEQTCADNAAMTDGGYPIGWQLLQGDILTETTKISSTPRWCINLVIGEGIAAHSSTTYTFIPGVGWTDTLHIAEHVTPITIYGLSVAEAIALKAALSAGHVGVIADVLRAHDDLSYILAVVIAQQFAVSDHVSSPLIYGLSLADAFRFNDGLYKFYSSVLIDHVSAHATLGVNFYPTANPADALHIASVLGNTLMFSIQLADDVELTDDELLRAIYQGDPLSDSISITAGYVSPDGNFTTWAINTRTNAVSEYQNWTFNSFAKRGSVYLGADRDGLYELQGSTDDGENIPASITSGLMALGGAKFTQFKGVYLSLRTKDDARDMVLKLVTGDGKSFIYAVRPNDMRTTKVHVGKGLRARYWAWTLSTVAADFDLEGVEFVPLISQRRV